MPFENARSVNYFVSDSSSLEALKLKNFKKINMPAGILEVENPSQPSYAEFEVELPFDFNEVICSVSAKIGEKDIIEPAIEINGEEFSCGKFSVGNSVSYLKSSERGLMDTDVLKLNQKTNKVRVKINLYNNSQSSGVIKLINIVFTDNTLPYNEKKEETSFKPISLPVPSISQMSQQVNYSQDICSPTSLAMVMSYYGVKKSPVEIAQRVIDNSNGIYGNWLFNTSYASYKGLYAFVARINSIEEAYEYLSKGIPIIASITFGPDELRNSPIRKSKGHLVVIKGFDKSGNFIVNDPAASEDKKVEIVYDKEEFSKAWLWNKFGTSYIIFTDIYKFMVPAFPYSDLFSISSDTKKQLETQILPGEEIKFLDKKEYIMTELLEQTTTNKKDEFLNYKGYIDRYAFALPLKYDAVVVNKNSFVYDKNYTRTDEIVSMGTKLSVLKTVEKDKNDFAIAMTGHKIIVLQLKDLNFLNSIIPDREEILKRARQFIGDAYYLGGRSSFGVDCSGLVNLVYRTLGLNIPRNAKDQYLKARKIAKKALKPGDLIFSTDVKSSFISHVMIYSGDGKIIESTQDSNSVREISLKEKFGIDFSKINNGVIVNGKKIYFGSIIKDPPHGLKNVKKSKVRINKSKTDRNVKSRLRGKGK